MNSDIEERERERLVKEMGLKKKNLYCYEPTVNFELTSHKSTIAMFIIIVTEIKVGVPICRETTCLVTSGP